MITKQNSNKAEKYELRPAKWADIEAIVGLRNASSQSTRGTDCSAVHWQKRSWHDANINLESDTLCMQNGQRMVAYAEVTHEAPYMVYEMAGAVHPDSRGQGLGSKLVKWAEERVGKAMTQAPADSAIFLQNSIFDSNYFGQVLLQAHGYKIVRDFVYLQINMGSQPADPTWPDGIEVRELQSEDWEKVGPALSEAFTDHWGVIDYENGEREQEDDETAPDPQQSDPEAFDTNYFNSPGLCFAAWDGDQAVGSCLCNAVTVEFPEAGYIGSLSVRLPWRQRGVGRALTLHVLKVFYQRGTTRVLTDTDQESLTQAYRVYQSVGMEIFRREHVFEKKIREGRDYVRRR